ncbi:MULTISPECIES: urea ABC transporter permease subunit UrtC [unclassified Mycobacterium]|uniref:urea ABC transporter permease subunit UrtC n=1 Tax=unclassified Mycobacterium TaxID=2642494 RepID=UPI0007404765|nr:MULTISPECIES: urea ABC transporter permease subunit UrtC [unclassified Mycobacterium]KUH88757.1 urea ABC transporter permease subunit UrtC [Mycobacterium sp. GA-0227b]KUH91051.1 urea ABC transporter permease subunit UrtC [Mycobacterium sp. GA-1999]KUH95404.1 urea ABC transporter permease subunit UrtC [Mycobacterium sp. IS-1556]
MRVLLGRWQTWAGFGVAAVLLFGVAPVVLSDFRLSLLGKFLCFAIVAVGIGLAWGRGGMLVLGQGVFFGMGGYMMGMHLKVADAQIRGNDVPDFMQIAGVRELPAYWQPFASPAFTLLAIVVLPTVIAAALGLGVFKRRVKGAYFAILSQALAAALAILLVGQASLGGSNGLNRFRTFFGFTLNDPANQRMLYFIAAGVLLLVVAVVRQLMQSRYGELLVAVRDGEERVRFLGYDPANIKVVAYAVAALFASIAGALFAPIVGFIAPSQVGILPSIAFLIGVAIGGRTTLLGPVLGAIGVAWAQTLFSERFPSEWTYAQGLLFIVVVGFFPAGFAGLGALYRRWRTRRPKPLPEVERPAAVDTDPDAEKVGAST